MRHLIFGDCLRLAEAGAMARMEEEMAAQLAAAKAAVFTKRKTKRKKRRNENEERQVLGRLPRADPSSRSWSRRHGARLCSHAGISPAKSSRSSSPPAAAAAI